MTDLIKPPHAISIWATNDILYAELPNAQTGEGQSHILQLPLNSFGITKCIGILKERSNASKFSTKGDPTQAQTEKAIAEMQRKAAGYTGPIKKETKVPLTEDRQNKIRDIIRRIIHV